MSFNVLNKKKSQLQFIKVNGIFLLIKYYFDNLFTNYNLYCIIKLFKKNFKLETYVRIKKYLLFSN